MLKPTAAGRRRIFQTGFSLIEVLVTIVIIAVGLLGLSGLQAKVSIMEMESYQRAQALSLLKDLEDQIRASRGTALTGALAKAAGTTVIDPHDGSTTCNGSTSLTCVWRDAIGGASESVGTTKVGAMIGARGCIASITPTEANALAEFYLVVVWQGLLPTADPDTGSYAADCASTVNFGTGLRRAAVTRVLIPKLDA